MKETGHTSGMKGAKIIEVLASGAWAIKIPTGLSVNIDDHSEETGAFLSNVTGTVVGFGKPVTTITGQTLYTVLLRVATEVAP